MRRHLLTLSIALLAGAAAVVMLRQEWAKSTSWPWLPLALSMFVAALALRNLERGLSGDPILPRLSVLATRSCRIFGVACISVAVMLAGLAVWRLWPNYRVWQLTPHFWLTALVFVLVGSWLVGALGQESPRAATAVTLWPDTRRNRWLEATAVTFIFALAVFLRIFRLDSIPAGIYVDETNAALDALHILEGRPDSPFGLGWYGTPNLYLYYMAAVFRLFGANWVSLKIVSLIPAILTVPAVYLLARLLFGPGAGLFAMFFMAVSRWHVSASRWGWNETAPPLFQIMCFFFLIRGLRDRRASDFALSGVLAGLSMYTYLSSRLAVLTLGIYIAFWFLSDPAGWRESARRSFRGIALLMVAATVVVGPLLVTYLSEPATFNSRVSEISILRDVRDAGTIQPLIQNIGDILRFFHQTGDHQGRHNLPDEPMADPITGLFFAVGLAYAVLGWREQRRFLLLSWLVIGLAGSFLSSHHESPQSYRSLTALPAAILMAADVLDRVVRALYRALRERSIQSSFPHSAKWITGAFAAAALAGAGVWESNVYFGRQADSIEVLRGFNPTENQVAHEAITALAAGKSVHLSPNFSEFSPLRFLTYGVIKAKADVNTLDDRPYNVALAWSLPFADDGHDVLMLLDSPYWALRDYIASFYPQADIKIVRLADNSPIYMRVEVSQAQVAALQGLIAHISHSDGRNEQRVVTQVEINAGPQVRQVIWEGALRIENGGEYDLLGNDALQVFIDDQPWKGQHYLGRGLYGLRVVQTGAARGDKGLAWRTPGKEAAPIPPHALFRIAGPRQGLLGAYYNNANWDGEPVFHQVAPYLLLAWPEEQQIAPGREFSVRFTGSLYVEVAGAYHLRIEADDGARLTLDEQVLGEGLVAGQPNGFEVRIDLAAGAHPIQIDYFQQGGGTALRFLWSHGDQPLTPVPPSALVPARM